MTGFTLSFALEAAFLVVAVVAGAARADRARRSASTGAMPPRAEVGERRSRLRSQEVELAAAGTRQRRAAPRAGTPDPRGDSYKWIALSNCTLGVLLATLDASITLIAMPDIFRGIKLDPLVPANSFYLLWMILGFLVVSSVLIVSLGRLGDMFGRVRIYNLGFVIYTVASLMLTVDWLTGRAGAMFLIVFRIVQGIGAACLLANSAAIITDAFPANQRGMALGINNIVGVCGHVRRARARRPAGPDQLAAGVPDLGPGRPVRHRLGLSQARRSSRRPRARRIDWAGNLTFALGLILIMVAVTYGIRPVRRLGDRLGQSPTVLILLGCGVALADRVRGDRDAASTDPMFSLPLFRIRAFTFGTLSTFLSAVARGGLMFMLIIWLQGIWLPQHGYRLHRHAAVGGHLHAAADARDAARRADLRVTSPTASARARSPPAG